MLFQTWSVEIHKYGKFFAQKQARNFRGYKFWERNEEKEATHLKTWNIKLDKADAEHNPI